MNKFGRKKIALALACASIFGGKTSAINSKSEVKNPQTLVAVGGAAVNYQTENTNKNKIKKIIGGTFIVGGVLETIHSFIGGFTDSKLGICSLGRAIKNRVKKNDQPRLDDDIQKMIKKAVLEYNGDEKENDNKENKFKKNTDHEKTNKKTNEVNIKQEEKKEENEEEKERNRRISILGKEYGEKFFDTIDDLVQNRKAKLCDGNKWKQFKFYGYTGTDVHTVEDIGKIINGTEVSKGGVTEGWKEVYTATIGTLANYKITNIKFEKTNDNKGIKFTHGDQTCSVSIDAGSLILNCGLSFVKIQI